MKTTPFRKRLKYSVLTAFKSTNQILHYDRNSNFGDMLNPKIANMLSQSSKVWVDPKYCSRKHILLLGSILQKATNHSIVWGSGFISAESKCLEAPHKVLAIRGPLSWSKLEQQGIAAPKVFGDPALLLPSLYQPSQTTKKYALGIIPHYVDKLSPQLDPFRRSDEVKFIDVNEPNPIDVIDQIASCRKILSSSLHGLIVADAYRIPNARLILSNLICGGDFKFDDYYKSVAKKHVVVDLAGNGIEMCQRMIPNDEINFDPTPLIQACPF